MVEEGVEEVEVLAEGIVLDDQVVLVKKDGFFFLQSNFFNDKSTPPYSK